MPIDREATLKKAEKLLRQGKLDGAIAEYVRLVAEQPKDWNSINALGDLYARAGQIENAAAQFVRIADHLYAEGFMPKAAAVYKKTLKLKSDDEHTLTRLADIATKAGVLVDAKTFYRQIADRRRKNGDQAGAQEIVIRLGEIDPADAEAKLQAARAAQERNDVERACEFLSDAAAAFEKQKKGPEALAALGEAVALAPDDAALRRRLMQALMAQGKVAEARAAARTLEELLPIAEALERDGNKDEALEVLVQAAGLDPENLPLRVRLVREFMAAGAVDRARQFLTAETAGDDPELLLALVRTELSAGRLDEGKAVLSRLLVLQPEKRDDLVFVGLDMAEQGHVDAAYACVELVADAALLEEDWGGAASALHEFVTRVPNQIPALMKLVEICVDGGLESTMYMAQSQLADAYLTAGLGAEARVIAEDLVAREPWVRANIERFRRALIMLGTADPDAIIAERLSGESPFLSTIDRPGDSEAVIPPDLSALDEIAVDLPDLPPLDAPAPQAVAAGAARGSDQGDGVGLDPLEVDLSDALTGLDAAAKTAPPMQDVLDDRRTKAVRESQLQDAQARYAVAIEHANHGRLDQAIAAFEAAASVPLMRFSAGARLGRLHVARGDLAKGVDWLERAVQAPAPTPDDSHAVMYELADALEHLGEHSRALAVLLELSAGAGEYRDIVERIDRLSKVQTRG